ncbi:MAG: M48 family metalloprotease, partial [bacterium]|nr:M48 family metalloprotease [bacterium]
NAFATSGSCSPDLICVLTGLLTEVKSSDELAAVVAHELVHNYKQHGSKQQNASILAILIGAIFLPNTSQSSADIFAGMMAMGFSRDQEAESDSKGLFLMTDAGFQPTAAVALWQRIAKKHGGGARIFMSHPPSPARAKELNRIVQKNLRRNPNGTWSILSRKTQSTNQAMNNRYKNAVGAGLVATGTYVVVEANRYEWDLSRFKGNKTWRDAGLWCSAGMVFGFIMPSDFIFFQNSLRNPTGNPPTGIRGKPMIGIGADQSYRVGLAVKF